MVGDRVVVVAAGPRGGHHLLQRRHAVGQAGVGVQVAAQVGLGDQGGQLAAQRGLHLAGVLAHAPAGSRPCPAAGRPPPRSGTRSARRSPASNRPYSDSLSLRRTAISRTRTLWAWEPVKYCSAAPQASSGITRRSTWSPALGPDRGLGRPRGDDLGRLGQRGERGHQRGRVLRRGQHVHVADRLPPPAQRAGVLAAQAAGRGADRGDHALGGLARPRSAAPGRRRPRAARCRAAARSSLLGPKPRRPARRPAAMAVAQLGGRADAQLGVELQGAACGPSAGIRVSASTPSGMSARSASSAANVPVAPISPTFSAMDLPTPGIRCSAAGLSAGMSRGVPADGPRRLLVGAGPQPVAAGHQQQLGVLARAAPRPCRWPGACAAATSSGRRRSS